MNKSWYLNDNERKMPYKVRGYVTRVEGWTFKVFSNVSRLHVNNHRSFICYSNIFVFRNVTSFGNTRHCLTTTVIKPCFALYVIHLVVRGVFFMFLVLMYSEEWALVCYVYTFHIFSVIFLKRTFNRSGYGWFNTACLIELNTDVFEFNVFLC